MCSVMEHSERSYREEMARQLEQPETAEKQESDTAE